MEPWLSSAKGMGEALAPLAIVFALLALATKRERVIEAVRRCRRETQTNIGLLLINYILLAPLYVLPVAALHSVLPKQPQIEAFWEALPFLLPLLAALLVIDLMAYWRHRLEHHPLMWRFHATHHADEQLHWLTVLRKHPVGHFLSMVVDNLPALLLGFPIWAIVVANLIRSWWGYFIHADVPWTLGPAGKILISPAAHRLHHIRDEELMGSNYANTVTIWDRMFGTWIDPAPHVNCETGIAEGSRGIWGELKRPWERRYRMGGQTETEADEATA